MKLETVINEIVEYYNKYNKMYDNCHKRTKEKK